MTLESYRVLFPGFVFQRVTIYSSDGQQDDG